MRFNEFIQVLSLTLITEYNRDHWMSWIKHAEYKDDPKSYILSSYCGRGHTANDSIKNLIDRIRGLYLILNAMNKDKRQEYQIPNDLTFDLPI